MPLSCDSRTTEGREAGDGWRIAIKALSLGNRFLMVVTPLEAARIGEPTKETYFQVCHLSIFDVCGIGRFGVRMVERRVSFSIKERL